MLALAGGQVYSIQADHLNAPRTVKNGSGVVVWKWESDAFGIGPTGSNPSGLFEFEFNLRFPGQQFDAETGLYYNNARYYDPATGRYISSDPIGLAGGINTYGYAGQAPTGAVDPNGLRADLNLFDPTEAPHSKPGPDYNGGISMWLRAEMMPSVPGVYSVAGHGTPNKLMDGRGGADSGTENDAAALLAIMEQAGYIRGTPIALWSCEAGKGPNSIAKQLSVLAGAVVIAHASWVRYPAGRLPVPSYAESGVSGVMGLVNRVTNTRVFLP